MLTVEERAFLAEMAAKHTPGGIPHDQSRHGRRRGRGGVAGSASRVVRDLTDEPEAFYEDLFKLGRRIPGEGTRNPTMMRIMELRGYDKAPRQVSKAEMDRQIKDGGTPLFRGVNDVQLSDGSKRTAADLIEDFRTGPNYAATGKYGSGIYLTPHEDSATGYANGNSENVVRAVLSPDARTISMRDAVKEIEKAREKINADYWERRNRVERDLLANGLTDKQRTDLLTEQRRLLASDDSQGQVFDDPGQWAALAGYDAITSQDGGEYVVLNRGALLVEA